jgi:hypothetical protein
MAGDDFTPLTSADHWLGWLGDDPARTLRDAIERSLQQQVPKATLNWVRLGPTPHFLTGGRRDPADEGKVIVTRAALAVTFDLEVDDGAGQIERLAGSYSWVAAGLDEGEGGRLDRVFFDLGASLDEARAALQARIYEIDAEREPDA